MKRFLPVIFAALLVAATAFWLLGPRAKLGRDNWFLIPNPVAWSYGAWLLPLGVLLIFGGFAAVSVYDFLHRAKTPAIRRNSLRLARTGIFVLALAWPFSLLGPTPVGTNGAANLIQATWSDVANGYFSASYQIDNVRNYTRSYALKRQNAASPTQAHVATHPPGAVLFYYGARRLYESVPPLKNFVEALARFLTNEDEDTLAADSRAVVHAATGASSDLPSSAVGAALWCAFVTALLLATSTFALFDLAGGRSEIDRTLPADEDAAKPSFSPELRGLTAASLFALAPMCGMFAFSLDAVIAAGAAWTLWLLSRGTNRSCVAAGALLATVSFLSYGALAIGVLGALALFRQRRLCAMHALIPCAAGFALGWAVILILWPHDAVRVFSQAMEAHRAATLTSRAHWPWSALNLLFFALFIGWPLVVSIAISRGSARFFGWGVAALLTAVLLSVSGNVRGEVERLWLFLLPPFAAWAGLAAIEEPVADAEYGRFSGYRWRGGFLVLLQAAQTLIMAATVAPLVRP